MTELQKEVMQKVNRMSEQDVKFLLIVIDKLIPDNRTTQVAANDKIAAFEKLNAVVEDMQKYLPENFNPEEEYKKALEEKYGNIA